MEKIIKKDVIIIGGGAAGLSAAIRLYQAGIKNLLLIERNDHLGGILTQCIHDGFGLVRYEETLSGPEYAKRLIDEVLALEMPILYQAMATEISQDKVLTVISAQGLQKYQASAILLTTGSRERTRGALSIPGQRPSGVYTAGVAQELINIHNKMVGKRVIILGSGDIGLIMARRLTLEGAQVLGVFEILPYPSGLARNVEQCLNDYDIPLHLSKTVTKIHGDNRIEAVTVSQVDENRQILFGTEETYPCDTLIMSVGLIPENELALTAGVALDPKTGGAQVDNSYQTSVPGIFAAGNALHIHDIVDYVSSEAEAVADQVLDYLKQDQAGPESLAIKVGEGVSYVVPHQVRKKKDFTLSFRVTKPMTRVSLTIKQGNRILAQKKFREVLPAEMIYFPLEAALIEGNQDLEVTVHA